MRPTDATTRRRRCALVIALLLVAPQASMAHVPQMRGRLIDLVSQSDLVVIGTVETVGPTDARLYDTTVRVEARILGEATEPGLTFRARPRFAPGQRFVFFLRRDGGGFECLQPSGTVFPSRPEDDAAYRAAVTGIQRALAMSVDQRPAALRATIIPALSATAAPLRYHAILELDALAHHGLTEPERQSLQRLIADPAADPALRPLVTSLLQASPTAP